MFLFVLLFGVMGMVIVSAVIKWQEENPDRRLKKGQGGLFSLAACDYGIDSDEPHWQSEPVSSGERRSTDINPATGLLMLDGIDSAGNAYGQSHLESDSLGSDITSFNSFSSFDNDTSSFDNDI